MAGEIKLNNVSIATENAGTVTIAPNNVQFAANHAGIKTALNASGNAPVYACRAWVNFNGTVDADISGTYSQSGLVITFTFASNHNLIVGNQIYPNFTTGTASAEVLIVDTVVSETVVTANSVTSRTTSGNFTANFNQIRESGNVSSITDYASGEYTINFSTAMPDANYSVSALSGKASTTYQSTTSTVTTNTISASGIRVMNREFGTNTVLDAEYMFVAIFR